MRKIIFNKGDELSSMLKYVDDYNVKGKTRCVYAECVCGNIKTYRLGNIRNGSTVSCGCVKKEIKPMLTHGMRYHKLYNVRKNMMSRCYNSNRKEYYHYGGRGITVCKDWHNISLFISDMYDSYKEGLSLDREDNNKGYYKYNCRWVDSKTQGRNKRNNILYKGKTISTRMEELGIERHILRDPVRRGKFANYGEAIEYVIVKQKRLDNLNETTS